MLRRVSPSTAVILVAPTASVCRLWPQSRAFLSKIYSSFSSPSTAAAAAAAGAGAGEPTPDPASSTGACEETGRPASPSRSRVTNSSGSEDGEKSTRDAASPAASSGKRQREFWEWEGPTPEHRALVLLLYRNVMKGLLQMKTIRRRSLTQYTRIMFRKRSHATEKLLIDECIEEARRAVYIIQKNINLTKTNEYEFDAMGLPKDTGQDVKTYMEDHYDPQVSRAAFEHIKDVEPGKEKYHNQRLAANDGYAQQKFMQGQNEAMKKMPELYGAHVSDEAKTFRPPPPKF